MALRHFPELHTNPVNVLIGSQPIRASRRSARWCLETIQQLWSARGGSIASGERAAAHQTFLKAMEIYRKIAAEADE